MASSARIDELRKKFDENPRRYFAPLANEYRKAGDLEEAIRICRANLPQQPGHMSGHIVFGQALFESAQLDEAREIFQAALALDPENLIALRHLGDIARATGDVAAARMWYQRVLDADPRNEEIAGQLAQLEPSREPLTLPADAQITSESEDSSGWGDINPEREQLDTVEQTGILDATTMAVEPMQLSDPGRVAPQPPPPPMPSFTMPEPAHAPAADFEPIDLEKSGELDLSDFTMPPPADAAAEAASVVPPAEPPAPVLFPGMAGIFGEPAGAESAPSSAASDLGLESMEFVPPPRSTGGPVAGFSATHEDAVLPTGAEETPAAFVTETMAELYLHQGFRDEALSVYRQLLAQNPHDDSLRERVESLQRGDRSSINLAAISDNVIEAAHRRQTTRAVRTIRSFFGTLAGRRVARPMGAPDDVTGMYDEALPSYEPAPPLESEWPGGAAPLPAMEWEAAAETPPPTDIVPDGDTATEEDLPPLGGSTFAPLPSPGAPPPPASYTPPSTRAVTPAATPSQPGPVNPRSLTPASASLSGTLDQLFSGADVSSSDETAANALAGAFAPDASSTTPSGRPARAASTELSLDHVFRDSPQSQQPRRSAGFSFDQFFSEGGAKKDLPAGEPRATPPDGGTNAGADGATGGARGSGGDIEQFHAWLEGLKKK